MIAFRDDSNKDKKLGDLTGKLQELLNIIHNNPEHYSGSFHENVDISEIIQVIYDNLYNEPKNSSLHLIIDKKPNNSLDLTIDRIE